MSELSSGANPDPARPARAFFLGRPPAPSPASAPSRLGCFVTWEAFLLGRDAEIAEHLGLPARVLTLLREEHMPLWEWFEFRLHTDPVDRAGRLSREEKRALRRVAVEQRARQAEECVARLRLSAGQEAGTQRDAEQDALPPASPVQQGNSPAPLWQRLTAGLMGLVSRLTGMACVLAALYFGPLWLAHHAVSMSVGVAGR